MSSSSTWPIDRILSRTTTPEHSGPGSNANEGVHWIPQTSSHTEASQSDCLVSYPRNSWGGFEPSVEMQLVYCMTQVNRAIVSQAYSWKYF